MNAPRERFKRFSCQKLYWELERLDISAVVACLEWDREEVHVGFAGSFKMNRQDLNCALASTIHGAGSWCPNIG
eukprot:355368-Chlamydomonas_euryale.AAC.15